MSTPHTPSGTFSVFRKQLIWDRLIAAVEEQAQTLVRTAFSPSTREAGDLSAGVFDTEGRMLAQAVTGTPGHINTMAAAVRHFLDRYPPEAMKPGDVYLTNDPWMGTGHLNDFTVVTPAHFEGETIALFAAAVHVIDIGGINVGITGRDVYEEGFYVPIMPLVREGKFDETLLLLLRSNVRQPIQVEGDLFSLVSSNQTGVERLLDIVREFGVPEFRAAGEHILAESRAAMLRALSTVPHGSWEAEMVIDGVDVPIRLKARVTVDDTGITVDFDGTDPASRFGINVPKTYADAYATYAVRCIIGSDVPNNAGSLGVVKVLSPEGCIINALRPAPVNSRALIGQLLPDVVFGALCQALPHLVPAEGASSLWSLRLSRGDPAEEAFNVITFNSGGMGARPGLDGLAATAFPSGVRNVPIEITESLTPMIFWRKSVRRGSGGAGKYRGGDGQVIEVSHIAGKPFVIDATFERMVHPARGRHGGEPGAPGRVNLASGTALAAKGRQTIPAGDRLIVEMPGGGGMGSPADRTDA